MKKAVSLSVTAILALFVTVIVHNSAIGATQYRLFLENEEIQFDVAPFVSNGRLLVSLSTISEATNSRADWNDDAGAATVHRGADRLILTIDSKTALYNDVPISIDVAPVIRNGQVFLPLRFISEWLGLQVNYDAETIRMYVLPPSSQHDTLDAPRGNSNGNLQSGAKMIIWQNRMYYTLSWDGFIYTDLTTGTTGNLGNSDGGQIQGQLHQYLQIWEDGLYLSYQTYRNGNLEDWFIQIDADGNIVQTVADMAAFGRIHNGWLYYSKTSPSLTRPLLCRRPLSGGEEESLNVYYPTQVIITDQHLFVYSANDGVMLRMNLDGSERRRLLVMPDIRALEYAEGFLYFSDASERNDTGLVYRMDIDGTGLGVFLHEPAFSIIANDGWLYYNTSTTPDEDFISGEKYNVWFPKAICRVRLDGSERETLAETTDAVRAFTYPQVFPDGSVYYVDNLNSMWAKIER